MLSIPDQKTFPKHATPVLAPSHHLWSGWRRAERDNQALDSLLPSPCFSCVAPWQLCWLCCYKPYLRLMIRFAIYTIHNFKWIKSCQIYPSKAHWHLLCAHSYVLTILYESIPTGRIHFHGTASNPGKCSLILEWNVHFPVQTAFPHPTCLHMICTAFLSQRSSLTVP